MNDKIFILLFFLIVCCLINQSQSARKCRKPGKKVKTVIDSIESKFESMESEIGSKIESLQHRPTININQQSWNPQSLAMNQQWTNGFGQQLTGLNRGNNLLTNPFGILVNRPADLSATSEAKINVPVSFPLQGLSSSSRSTTSSSSSMAEMIGKQFAPWRESASSSASSSKRGSSVDLQEATALELNKRLQKAQSAQWNIPKIQQQATFHSSSSSSSAISSSSESQVELISPEFSSIQISSHSESSSSAESSESEVKVTLPKSLPEKESPSPSSSKAQVNVSQFSTTKASTSSPTSSSPSASKQQSVSVKASESVASLETPSSSSKISKIPSRSASPPTAPSNQSPSISSSIAPRATLESSFITPSSSSSVSPQITTKVSTLSTLATQESSVPHSSSLTSSIQSPSPSPFSSSETNTKQLPSTTSSMISSVANPTQETKASVEVTKASSEVSKQPRTSKSSMTPSPSSSIDTKPSKTTERILPTLTMKTEGNTLNTLSSSSYTSKEEVIVPVSSSIEKASSLTSSFSSFQSTRSKEEFSTRKVSPSSSSLVTLTAEASPVPQPNSLTSSIQSPSDSSSSETNTKQLPSLTSFAPSPVAKPTQETKASVEVTKASSEVSQQPRTSKSSMTPSPSSSIDTKPSKRSERISPTLNAPNSPLSLITARVTQLLMKRPPNGTEYKKESDYVNPNIVIPKLEFHHNVPNEEQVNGQKPDLQFPRESISTTSTDTLSYDQKQELAIQALAQMLEKEKSKYFSPSSSVESSEINVPSQDPSTRSSSIISKASQSTKQLQELESDRIEFFDSLSSSSRFSVSPPTAPSNQSPSISSSISPRAALESSFIHSSSSSETLTEKLSSITSSVSSPATKPPQETQVSDRLLGVTSAPSSPSSSTTTRVTQLRMKRPPNGTEYKKESDYVNPNIVIPKLEFHQNVPNEEQVNGQKPDLQFPQESISTTSTDTLSYDQKQELALQALAQMLQNKKSNQNGIWNIPNNQQQSTLYSSSSLASQSSKSSSFGATSSSSKIEPQFPFLEESISSSSSADQKQFFTALEISESLKKSQSTSFSASETELTPLTFFQKDRSSSSFPVASLDKLNFDQRQTPSQDSLSFAASQSESLQSPLTLSQILQGQFESSGESQSTNQRQSLEAFSSNPYSAASSLQVDGQGNQDGLSSQVAQRRSQARKQLNSQPTSSSSSSSSFQSVLTVDQPQSIESLRTRARTASQQSEKDESLAFQKKLSYEQLESLSSAEAQYRVEPAREGQATTNRRTSQSMSNLLDALRNQLKVTSQQLTGDPTEDMIIIQLRQEISQSRTIEQLQRIHRIMINQPAEIQQAIKLQLILKVVQLQQSLNQQTTAEEINEIQALILSLIEHDDFMEHGTGLLEEITSRMEDVVGHIIG